MGYCPRFGWYERLSFNLSQGSDKGGKKNVKFIGIKLLGENNYDTLSVPKKSLPPSPPPLKKLNPKPTSDDDNNNVTLRVPKKSVQAPQPPVEKTNPKPTSNDMPNDDSNRDTLRAPKKKSLAPLPPIEMMNPKPTSNDDKNLDDIIGEKSKTLPNIVIPVPLENDKEHTPNEPKKSVRFNSYVAEYSRDDVNLSNDDPKKSIDSIISNDQNVESENIADTENEMTTSHESESNVNVDLRNGDKLTYNVKDNSVSYQETNKNDKKIKEKPVSDFLQTSKNVSKKRKEGVLISAVDTSDGTSDIVYMEKDERTSELIKKALMGNDFIKSLLNKEKLNSVIQAMQPEEIKADTYIIKEGETGSHLYVSDEGNFSVLQNNKLLKTFGPGEAFGELAVLYKAKRFASVLANTDSKIWLLERKIFQKIMMRSKKQEEEENINFLSSVPDLKNIHHANIVKMTEFLKRRFFPTNTAIIRQGDIGDTFYIIKGGTVIVSKNLQDGGPDKIVKELSKGDYFGEQALLHDEVRSATIIAKAPGVECLLLERGPFNEFLGDIDNLRKRRFTIMPPRKPSKPQVKQKLYEQIELTDLKLIGTLGVGAFGRVELMQCTKNESMTFALKRLKKYDVVMQQLERYAFNEKSIMFLCNSPFICKLYRTYKDNKYLYFLMEPILGGDIWSVLQKSRGVEEKTARFVAGCVVEAFEYLHSRNIVYRDLKPENIMLDAKGYAKLVDFGYAKILPNDAKTYTFAGTPEYVAPEIILGNAHDRAVDYWTLGIFIYELLAGRPPFRGTNHVNTYSLIIRGIDEVQFHSKIKNMAQSLIRKLCRPVSVHRLGYLRRGIKDIKTHKFFYDFDWKKLRNCKMTAPLIIPIASNKDISNFDIYEKDIIPPDENSGWDIDF